MFVSYAQNGEDVLLYRALRHIERGCYIDVGAAEPVTDSVTCAFYERGWRGINIEPAPGAFARLAAARPEDVNLNIAASDSDGIIPFFLIDDGNVLSTAVPGQMAALAAQGFQAAETRVQTRTLHSVVAEYITAIPVHFLKIDVEGGERAVLAGANLLQFRPWIILVEATAPNSPQPTHQAWEDILLAAGYRFAWFDGLNRFYLAAERQDLAVHLQAQPNVFDDFVKHSETVALAAMAATRAELADAAVRLAKLNANNAALRREADSLRQERDTLLRLAMAAPSAAPRARRRKP